uniref:Uncharacterized protein n=1 Tax=Knipowitschia caucasica TaxID=637954 RepID=A0AAV2JNG6_KNICA
MQGRGQGSRSGCYCQVLSSGSSRFQVPRAGSRVRFSGQGRSQVSRCKGRWLGLACSRQRRLVQVSSQGLWSSACQVRGQGQGQLLVRVSRSGCAVRFSGAGSAGLLRGMEGWVGVISQGAPDGGFAFKVASQNGIDPVCRNLAGALWVTLRPRERGGEAAHTAAPRAARPPSPLGGLQGRSGMRRCKDRGVEGGAVEDVPAKMTGGKPLWF